MEDASKREVSPCSSKFFKPIKEKELRKKAMKLDLAPIVGKAFRYVQVNKEGEWEEVDEHIVRERRECFLKGAPPIKKAPMKKLRKARPVSAAASSANADVTNGEDLTRPEWLPDSFTVTAASRMHISGWVNSEEELAQVIANHTAAFSCKFVSWYRGKGLSKTHDSKRVAWKREDIEPGCPFTIDNYLVRHCPYGMQLKRLAKARESYRGIESNDESKQNIACRARLKIRRVTLYDDFKLNEEEKTRKIMLEKMMSVKQLIDQGQGMNTTSRVYLQLPLLAAHNNHQVPKSGDTVKAGLNCVTEGHKEEEIAMNSVNTEGGELPCSTSKTSKMEVRELDDLSQSMRHAFELEALPLDTGDPSDPGNDPWKIESSFITHAMNDVLIPNDQQTTDDGVKRVRENTEFHFELRPPHKRTHILSSCKVNCPARIKVKRVSLYESFRLDHGDSQRKKDDKMLMVKDMISSGADDLQATPVIFMQLPLAAAHRNHQVSIPVADHQYEACGRSKPVGFEVSHFGMTQQPQSWLPQSFTVTSCGLEYLTGWVRTEEDYLQVMENHRHAFNCVFLAWSNDKERTFKAETDRRVMWKKDFVDPGCPLTVHHSLILACAYNDQSKGKTHTSAADSQPVRSRLVAETEGVESIVQVPTEHVPEGATLEIQYFDAAPQYPELQSLIKQDKTYIIFVENS